LQDESVIYRVEVRSCTHIYTGGYPSLTLIKIAVNAFFESLPEVLSVAKVLLPLMCFKPLQLENRRRYNKKAFYEID